MPTYSEETNEEKLRRLGRTRPVTSASSHGKIPTQNVLYGTNEWLYEQRMEVLTAEPTDENGLGYQYQTLEEPQV